MTKKPKMRKKLFSFALCFAMLLSLQANVYAYNYQFESGVDNKDVFGGSTSTDEAVTQNPETENIRRNKDAAYTPPAYAVFSGEIPTNPTSPYHDNAKPNSGYTGNTASGAYSSISSDLTGGNVSNSTGNATVNDNANGGILPSTSVYTQETVNILPMYYDDGSIGTLSIPKLKKTIKVWEGESLDNMKKGVGHFEYTSTWDGTVGFAGHNRGSTGYFEGVKNLKTGDTMTYTTKYGSRTYEVFSKEKISDTDYANLGWSAENIVVLITCVENTPSLRWCVMAREI